MRILAKLFVFCSFLFLMACASKVRPTGGDKDVTAPVVKNYSPALYSTNFKSRQIIINFDEYVQLKEPFKQIIISPLISPNATFAIKKKSLYIELPDSLFKNTTYTINFGASVVDVNENNVIENFQYVFSTGSIIDSLKVSGKLVLAKDNSPQKDVVVMLHKNLTDTSFINNIPNYICRTNELGVFELQNISPGKYNMYALLEENNNYKYDRPEELIAFEQTSFSVPDSTGHYLRIFKNAPLKLKILNNTSGGLGKQVIIFNQPVNPELLNIQCIEQEIEFRKDFSVRKDTLALLWKNYELEKFSLAVNYDRNVIDTLKVSNSTNVKQRGGTKKTTTPKLNIKPNFAQSSLLHRHVPFSISFTNPVFSINNDSIMLLADSIPVPEFTLVLEDSSNYKAGSSYAFEDDVTYNIQFWPGAFIDYFENTNDTIVYTCSVKPERQYGSMQINFSGIDYEKENLLLQILKGEDKLYRQENITGPSLELEYLNPDSYTLRLISDANQNGVWDTGDYTTKLQPEFVLNYGSPINVRANWDVVIDWKIR